MDFIFPVEYLCGIEYCCMWMLLVDCCMVFRSDVSEWMRCKAADECENHYKQFYLIRPQSPLPGTDI